jgi:hypothetical protein
LKSCLIGIASALCALSGCISPPQMLDAGQQCGHLAADSQEQTECVQDVELINAERREQWRELMNEATDEEAPAPSYGPPPIDSSLFEPPAAPQSVLSTENDTKYLQHLHPAPPPPLLPYVHCAVPALCAP